MTADNGMILGEFIGDKTSDEAAEWMTTMLEVIKQWYEMKGFKNLF